MEESKNNPKIWILDTSILLMKRIPNVKDTRFITTPLVMNEIYRDELTKKIVEAYVTSGTLIVEEPDKIYIEKARSLARKMGELNKLSEADIQIIALSMKYTGNHDVTVVTDDYSIQNILETLKINYLPIRRKIRRKVKRWVFKCVKCDRIYPTPFNECPVCGGEISRRPG